MRSYHVVSVFSYLAIKCCQGCGSSLEQVRNREAKVHADRRSCRLLIDLWNGRASAVREGDGWRVTWGALEVRVTNRRMEVVFEDVLQLFVLVKEGDKEWEKVRERSRLCIPLRFRTDDL